MVCWYKSNMLLVQVGGFGAIWGMEVLAVGGARGTGWLEGIHPLLLAVPGSGQVVDG